MLHLIIFVLVVCLIYAIACTLLGTAIYLGEIGVYDEAGRTLANVLYHVWGWFRDKINGLLVRLGWKKEVHVENNVLHVNFDTTSKSCY